MAQRGTDVGRAVASIATGTLGIVTEDVKLSGPNKDKLTVQFIGWNWQIGILPSEVEFIKIERKV